MWTAASRWVPLDSLLELLVAAALILVNGVFSVSELAVVSARRSRLATLAEAGNPGAVAALRLAEEPGRFLSAVQIGITLIGILAGAFSGAALGGRLTVVLQTYGVSESLAETLGYGLVIAAITYLSVVVGELVPKTLALRNPERIACAVARPMTVVAAAAGPAVWLLDASTRAALRLLRLDTAPDATVTGEEIRSMAREAATAGVIEAGERDMIDAVLRFGDRAVRGVMTPRTDVEILDLDADETSLRAALLASRHARLPVRRGGGDEFVGILPVRDLVPVLLTGAPLDLEAAVRPAPVLLDTTGALDALVTLRRAAVPMALVHDEYGHFEGVLTPADILDAIAGAFRSDEGQDGEEAVQRADGSWLIAGRMPADEMADRIGLKLPDRRDYETAAGLVLSEFKHLPATGESVTALGWRFEVVDLDGRRIDKILASRAENLPG